MKGKTTWKAVVLGVFLAVMPLSVQAAFIDHTAAATEVTTDEVIDEVTTEAVTESELTSGDVPETEETENDGEGDGSTSNQKTGTLESTASSVTIVWPSDAEANKGYRIYVRKGNKYVKVGQTSEEENQFVITEIKGKPLEPSTTYTIKVVALKGKGSKTKTLWRRIIRTATAPDTPVWVSSKRVSGKKAVLKWKKVKNISGYELQLSRYKKKGYKTVDLIKPAKIKFTVKSLKKSKKYYVRIRTYKTVTGGRVYSPWSKVKKI